MKTLSLLMQAKMGFPQTWIFSMKPLFKIKRAYISWWIYQTTKCNVIIMKIVINNNSFFSKGASVLVLYNSMLISQKVHRIDLID